MNTLADSHGHLTMVFRGPEARWPKGPATPDEVGLQVRRGRENEVTHVLVPATSRDGVAHVVEVAEVQDGAFAAVGIHPHETKGTSWFSTTPRRPAPPPAAPSRGSRATPL